MKKIIPLIILLLAASLLSCQKEYLSLTPKITILSPNGGEIYQVGEFITVKWKTENISPGSNIIATLISEKPNNGVIGVGIHPHNQIISRIYIVTDNDGEEIYQLPWKFSTEGVLIYDNILGTKSFKIELNIVDQNGHRTLIETESNAFTIIPSILPDGCNSIFGYSSTTGLPCQ